MNCDVETFPDADDYLNDDETIWWADAQQLLLRITGYSFNKYPAHRWFDYAKELIDEGPKLSLGSAINPCDPYLYFSDENGEMQYLSVEDRNNSLETFVGDFIINILKYKNGENVFNDDELPGLLRKESPRFLSRLMEYQMAGSLQEQFVHSAEVIASGISYYENLQNWKIPSFTEEMQDSVQKPAPQPYGVSHEGAEALVRDWMLYLGISSAEITRFSNDGGIDVSSVTYVAQVKNYKDFVGVQAIREILGVAVAEGKKPLFFTSGSFTTEALSFADKAGVPLFIYDAAEGTLERVNEAAENVYRQRLFVDQGELVKEVEDKLIQISTCLISVKGSLKTSKRVLNTFFPTKESEIETLKLLIDPIDCSAEQLSIDVPNIEDLTSFSELVNRLETNKQELQKLINPCKQFLALAN